MIGALVEVRQAEEDGGEDERGRASHAAFEQVLQPSAKEKLLWHCDQEKSEGKGGESMHRVGHDGVEVKEADSEPQCNCYGRVEEELAPADAEIAQSEPEVESDAVKLADAEEGVDAGVQQQNFIEGAEARGPRGLKPAKIDGEAKHNEYEKVSPVAALVGVGAPGAVEKHRDGDGQQRIEHEPAPLKDVRGAGDERVGNAEERGEQEPHRHRQALGLRGGGGEKCRR